MTATIGDLACFISTILLHPRHVCDYAPANAGRDILIRDSAMTSAEATTSATELQRIISEWHRSQA